MARPREPRFCSACGGELPGPVSRCPRCGAAVVRARRGIGPVALVALIFVLGCSCLLAILVAAAIPGFLRHRIRSREVDVKIELQALLQAEQGALEKQGAFVEFDPLPAQPPGPTRTPLSAAERSVAQRLGWAIGPATRGQFRMAVARDPSGAQAASFCAETDLDGDGTRAAHVAFLPALRDDGAAFAPPAPCTRAVPYSERYGPGEVVKVEPLNF